MSRSGPPRLVTWLLEAALPPTLRSQQVVGDLHEEYLERAAHGGIRARFWYARAALGVVARYALYARSRRGVGALIRDRGEGLVEAVVRNVRYSMRRLTKNPAFTLVAVASLALGIGANTAMFSLINAVIIRDKPFEDPERLVDIYEAGLGFSHGALSYPDYRDLTEASEGVFTEVGGAQITLVQADADGGVELLLGEAVTGNYFELLGIDAAMGRVLTDEDHIDRGAHPVVVLSHGYWVRRLGADPSAVGSELRLGGRQYTVVGVAPPRFEGFLRGLRPDVWVPIMMLDELEGSSGNTLEARGNQGFFARGRLAPGATFAQAEAVAERATMRLRSEFPEQWAPEDAFVLEPTASVIMNPMVDRYLIPAAVMIMGVVAMVLLIACANLASFLLARATDRRKEIAIRLAMGAGRRTLVGQLLTETLLLAALGGTLGIVVARYALDALATADLPLPIPVTLDLSLDSTVLGFSVLVSALAGVLFGLAPAVQSTNPDVAPTLRDESAGGGRGRSAALRSLLVSGQVAVSVVLLVGAGLFLRSLDASRSIDPGFGGEPTGLLQLTLPADRYDEPGGLAYLRQLTERIESIDGVRAVGLIDNLHLNQRNTQYVRVEVDGVEPPPGSDRHVVDHGRVFGAFFSAAGIELVEGRVFDESDRADSEPVAVVNREFVRRFFPDGSAVGSTVRINGTSTRVVGVTADHKVRSLGEAPRPFVYRSLPQSYTNYVTVLARTAGDDARLAADMMREARGLDPSIMVIETKTMERHLATMLIGREMGAWVVGGFALLALLLASIGVYGVVSYAVAQRAREVGIRLSLGAESGTMVRMLVFAGMKLTVVGMAIGLLVALAAAQLLARLLYGVPPLDPLTFLTVPAVLGAVALLASWIPAIRVGRIDPVQALRSE